MPPKIGGKKIYLPNFTVALLRTPHLPANYAQFLVPLSLNKLDMRDYLHHAYNVEALAVRSFITQQKIERHKPGFQGTRWYRPRSIKKMTVELRRPFVYPAEPEDLTPWDNALHKALKKERDEGAKVFGPAKYKYAKPGRGDMRELAETVVEEREVEVEKDVKLP